MNDLTGDAGRWLDEHEGTLTGVTRRPDGAWDFTATAGKTRPAAAAARPERAVYEAAAFLLASGVIEVPGLPWELLTPDERDGWARIRQAGLGTGAPS